HLAAAGVAVGAGRRGARVRARAWRVRRDDRRRRQHSGRDADAGRGDLHRHRDRARRRSDRAAARLRGDRLCRVVGVEPAGGPASGMIAVDIELTQGTFTLAAAFQLEARAAALFGPSGAGKTTILDAIAGLRTPSRGTIAIDGRVLYASAQRISLAPYRRHV